MQRKQLSLFSMMLLLPLIFGVILLGLLSNHAAHAAPNATITVTNLNNSGAGSFRQAINDANGHDTIDFNISGTIVLTTEIFISKSLTIDGGGVISVSGNNATRLFNVTAGHVTFDNLTITGGNAAHGDFGGGVYNNGTLTVTNSTIFDNVAHYGDGGGIFNDVDGTLIVTNSTISDNSTDLSFGGGIYNNGSLTVTNSTISGNSTDYGVGGGIFNNADSILTVTNSIISGNSAYYGGGVYNWTGTFGVTNSTISGNSAVYGGGIRNNGSLTVTNSTISDNSATLDRGGGIFNDVDGTFSVTNSTISGNSAADAGGGIFNRGTLIVTNSTISGNSANFYGDGGGISNSGTLTVANSTISGNSADTNGGIKNDGGIDISNTIIANSTSGGNCGGTIPDGGYNLADDGSCGFALVEDPLLAPLADNGGDTQTHALLPGSLAINAGDCTTGPTTDQRSVPRPQDNTCDIGAFESRGFTISAASGIQQTTPVSNSFANPLAFTVSSAFGEPVAGGTVIFIAPDSGAGLTFTTTAVTIGSSGTVSLPVTANDTVGSYTVTADFSGNSDDPLIYQLTNLAQVFLPIILSP